MKSIKHIYLSKTQTILFWAFNLFGSYFVLGSFYVAIVVANDNTLKERFYLFIFFIIWGMCILFFANLFPEIVSDENGLAIRFFLWYIKVKWEDIVGIKQMSFLSFLSRTSNYVVKTKSLTPFHRFYGLYGFSFAPSFLVTSEIKDFDLLKERLEKRNKN